MAQPNTARFGKFIVSIWDGSAFVAPCGFTSKALNLGKNLSEVPIPDCADPDAPFWIARDVQSLTAAVSGEGLLAEESVDVWLDAYYSTSSVETQVEIEFPGLTRTFTGLMHVESVNITAEQGGRVQASISMQSDGELVRA